MAVDLHGVLDRNQLGLLGSLMQRSIYVASGLPNSETGFPIIKIVPAKFVAKIVNEAIGEDLQLSTYVAEDHALKVVEKDTRLLSDGHSESDDDTMTSDESDEDRMTTMVFWLKNKSSCVDHTREMLNTTRDIVIRAIRDVMPSSADPMDHMIAGAYIRTMMVVNSPDFGPRAQTAIFSVASFEDQPQTLVFKFVAGAEDTSGSIVDYLESPFPNVSNAMISLDSASIAWLGSDVASKITAENTESAADDDKDDVESWEQSVSVQLPDIPFRTVSEGTASKMYAGPTTVVQMPGGKKTPYCDQFYDSISACMAESCYCLGCYKKPAATTNDNTPKPQQLQTQQPSRTLVQPLIR